MPDGAGAGTPNEVNGVGDYKPGLVVTGGDVEEVESARQLREFVVDSGFAGLAVDAFFERFSSGWMI